MSILQYSLVQGKEEDFENGLELLNIIINATDEERLEPYAAKILGILVRILNYRRDAMIKKKIIEMIDFF